MAPKFLAAVLAVCLFGSSFARYNEAVVHKAVTQQEVNGAGGDYSAEMGAPSEMESRSFAVTVSTAGLILGLGKARPHRQHRLRHRLRAALQFPTSHPNLQMGVDLQDPPAMPDCRRECQLQELQTTSGQRRFPSRRWPAQGPRQMLILVTIFRLTKSKSSFQSA